MTELISGFPQPHLAPSYFDFMPDGTDDHRHWHHQQQQQHHQQQQHQLLDQLPMVAAQWMQHQQQPPQMAPTMHDYPLYPHQTQTYLHPSYPQTLLSPSLPYSDMETSNTPSTPGFDPEPFPQPHPTHLHRLPPSSHDTQSPPLTRPTLPPRSISDQTPNPHAHPSPGSDEEFAVPPPRGRKRQRIPHTAVERRYRENLNAHLEKLRQTVPALARRGTDQGKGDGAGGGVKPSKCEVLNGAIEYIGQLGKEVEGLRAENAALRARVEGWYGPGPRSR